MVRQLRELLAAHSSAAATEVASLTALTGSVRGSLADFVSSHEAQLHHLQEGNTSNHDIILREKIATEDELIKEEKRLLESMAAQAEEHVFMAKVLQTGRSTFEANLSAMLLYAQETREVNEGLVSSASAIVSTIQHAVRETSAVLEKSVQGSLAGFNEDMEGSGEIVRSCAQTYFRTEIQHLQGQEATLQTVAEDTDTYGRVVAKGKLASVGNTPVKSPFTALRALPIGRPVETIRVEVLMRNITPKNQASEGERNTPMSDCNDEGGGLPPVDAENMDPQDEMLANTTALAATELLLPIALSKPDLKKSRSSGNAMNNRSSSRIRAPSSRAN